MEDEELFCIGIVFDFDDIKGRIKDKYQDYGRLGTKEDGSPKYDMYEVLAFWNKAKGLKYGFTNGNKYEHVQPKLTDKEFEEKYYNKYDSVDFLKL